ncbi:MAG: hypothetical protein ABIB71_02275, partial [Candidatus Woesearchaeota archaeon]
ASDPEKTLNLLYPYSRGVRTGVANVTYKKLPEKKISTKTLLNEYVNLQRIDNGGNMDPINTLDNIDLDMFDIDADGIIEDISYDILKNGDSK